MMYIRLSRFFSFFISLSLLLSPLPLTAMTQDLVAISRADLDAEVRMQTSDFNQFLNELFMLETIEPGNETATRPFTNIIQVQGLLSVNDELVQNITAINVSVTDEIVQNSTMGVLSATDSIIQNATITTLSTTDQIINNLTATNISVVDETVTGILSANDGIINNYLRFKDSSTNYIGMQAPSAVTSYTMTLPAVAPAVNQVLRAGATTPTNLAWATDSAFVVPANSQTIYVAVYGNDTTGNGSLATPYATLAKAISIANGLASSSNPITISIGTGTYVEDNSASPLTVTADGIAIIGQVSSNVILMPNTPANNFILVNTPIHISNITLESSNPLATGLTLAAGSFTAIINVDFVNFLVGAECEGSPTNSYGFVDCFFVNNGTGLMVNNAYVSVQDITLFGTSSPSGPSVNTGISATGSGANLVMNGGVIGLCNTAITLLSNAVSTITSLALRLNTFDITQSGASNLALSACNFQLTTGSSDIKIQATGAGTVTEIAGCEFNGLSSASVVQGIGIQVTNGAVAYISGGAIQDYTTGIQDGLSTDTSSTFVNATALIIHNCTNDIVQNGTTTLNINASTASSSKIAINDSTNVDMAFFDLDDSNALTIGSYANQDTVLLQAAINSSTHPELQYKTSLYSTEGIGFFNPAASPSSLFVQSSQNANITAVTTSITDVASLRLASDTGVPVGGTSALRGWDINKNASTSELSFNFQNSDVSDSEPVVTEFTVLQLDGFNNLVQLPTAGTKIVFDSDTNLYRNAANVLKTDGNFIVGTLTANRAVITDSSDQLASSATTATEISYVSGVTSSIQTQINSKVAKAGDTMTGALILPAGSAAAPSLQFTGSTNTGLSAATANVLSFDINGSEQMNLSSSGLTIDAFNTAGVVHNSSSGLLSSSLIIDADITTATITNDKLANISSSNIANDIVVRDGSGNFATNMITLAGTTTNSTDAATKAYVDSVASTGLVSHTACVVVSTTDIGSPPTGAQTIDGYSVATNDRILLIGQTNEIYNGIWLANTTGAWTYPSDWAVGTTAGEAYVLITSGATNAGSSWLCNTPTATIGTDNITFAEFSLPSTTTGNNVGGGAGQVFQSKTGVTLNFRTLSAADTHISIVNNSDNIGFSTDATSTNTASTIVARDASGNFSAGTITASLTGHASSDLPLTGGTLTGTLTVPAGSATIPSLQFTGSTNTGLSAATANVLSLDINGSEIMNLSASGVTIDAFSTAGVVHNSAAGLLSSSLIVNADVSASAAIVDTKLATISTTGKVANSATTATSANTASAIVARDGSGNFSAGTITASLTGAASANVLKAGDTMTGTLQLPAGTTALPSLVFTGSTTAGLSANTGNLSFSTNALERLKISSGGTISIDAFSTAGVIHNDASGNLSSSLIVNADISASAGITDNKLATISTAGKVANSATTATNLNTASAIVARDASGSFAAGLISVTDEVISNSVTITPLSTAGVIHNNASGLLSSSLIVDADITTATITNDKLANISSSNIANDIVVRDGSGNFAAGTITANLTGHASSDLPLTGGTLTGTLTLPAGSAAIPSLQFTGSTNTGLSAATANTLSFDISGTEQMNLSSSGLTIDAFSTAGVVHNSAAGLLSSSLIVNADITNATIANTKLAAISSSNIANDIVLRDGTGSFAAQEISMNDGILAGNLILTTEPSTSTAGNIIKGANSFIHDFGTDSTFVGITAGNFTLSGSGNTGLGKNSLAALTSGAFNTAVGVSSMTGSTTASLSTALGYQAMSASGANSSVAIGYQAMQNASPLRNGNVAVGMQTLVNDTTGGNVAVGYQALQADTTGGGNTAIGYTTLTLNTVGQNNTALGYTALSANTTATDNTALGSVAGAAITTGSNNIAIGSGSGANLTTGSGNIYLNANAATAAESATTRIGTSQTACYIQGISGVTPSGTLQTVTINSSGQLGSSTSLPTGTNLNTPNTLVERDGTGSFAAQEISMNDGILSGNLVFTGATSTSTTGNITKGGSSFVHNFGTNNTFVGIAAGNFTMTGTNNTGFGINTLQAITTGSNNTAVGTSALAAHTTASGCTAIGNNALAVSNANNNTAVGSAALAANTTGVRNVAVGSSALAANTIGKDNTAVGYIALLSNSTGSQNTAVGQGALQLNTIGIDNTAIGYNALATNATGNYNTAIGNSTLTANTIGTNNTAVGINALNSNTTGISNTAIGSAALQFNATGNYNTAIGMSTLTANTIGTNNTAVGINALNSNTTGTDNTAIGSAALQFNTTGTPNTAVGRSALAANTIGVYNTAVGFQALTANTTGGLNTGIGVGALAANATGSSNTAVGQNALQNANANNNTAVGQNALNANTTGTPNTAVGQNALAGNTIGVYNTAVGFQALTANTTGGLNTGIGVGALAANVIGSGNTAVGTNALQNANTNNNTAVGTNALNANSTGTNNTAVGQGALSTNTIGIQNVAVGQNALNANTTGNYNTAVGQGALQLNTTGTLNTAVGTIALESNTIGTNNTAVGDNALQSNTTGNNNTGLGQGALAANAVGSNNTAVGLSALNSNSVGSNNTAVGVSALSVSTTDGNTAVGYQALTADTTGINTAVGYQALAANNIGSNNTAIGWQALVSNTTGNQNTAIGQEALKANGVGSFNTAVGYQALLKTTNGSNTAVGYQALANNTGGSQNTALGLGALSSNTTGANNTALGYSTLINLTTGSNNIAIGNGAGNGTATGSGNVYIGAAVTITANESNVTRIQNINGINVTGSAVLVSSTGQLGMNTSTRTVKHAIEDMNDESADILKLRPVTFVYNSDETETKQYGLIAEEVDEIFPGIVGRTEYGEIQTVHYHILPVLLLNEMQKQQKTIEQQQENIAKLSITTESMNTAINSLQAQLQQFMQRMDILENNA